jgi:CRP-like cAMP-binding protein
MSTSLTILNHAGEPQVYLDGENVFTAGEHGTAMYAVINGEVEIVVNGIVVETVGGGGVFGEMALIEHLERSATARAKGKADVVMIDEKRFLFLVANHPTFALDMMRVLASRLRHMDQMI